MTRVVDGISSGVRWPVFWQYSLIRCGWLPGETNSSRSNTVSIGLASAARGGELGVSELLTIALPGALAFLQHPKAGDVFQKTDPIGHAGFISEIGCERRVINHWFVQFPLPSVTRCPS